MAASVVIVLSPFFCLLLSASAGRQIKEITAQPGDDATLSCQAPNNVNIAAVEWVRSDPERQVYLKSDGHLMTADQDPSYVNRVQLEDDEMKNGDLSLILKNVTNNDKGTYVCRYVEERGGRRKRADQRKPISIVYLDVTGGDPESGKDSEDGKDKRQHLVAFVSVTLTAVLGLVGFATYKKLKGHSEKKPILPVVDPDVQPLQENENSQKTITHNISDTQV